MQDRNMATVLTPPPDNRRLVFRLVLLALGALAFGFALVPFYDVLCRATGFNGKTLGLAPGGLNSTAAPKSRVDYTRNVRVEFTGTVMPGLPWDMRPLTTALELHPGEMQEARFLVRNTSNRTIIGQAVPSVSPGQAAQHFEKIDCFCFRQQALGPGESREMPVTFIIKPEMDKDISTLTLSYAFYPAPEGASKNRE